MSASLYSPPLTLGGHIWKPAPLTVRLSEVFLPHSPRLPVTGLHPQIASPPLLYSFLWSGGPVHVPRGWQGHHNANPCLEKDWDPKMCCVGRWNCVSLPSFMAWQYKCSAWPDIQNTRCCAKCIWWFFHRYLLECCYIPGSSYVSLQQKKCLTVLYRHDPTHWTGQLWRIVGWRWIVICFESSKNNNKPKTLSNTNTVTSQLPGSIFTKETMTIQEDSKSLLREKKKKSRSDIKHI